MSTCLKCLRLFNDGNSPNEFECNGTDDDEGLCAAYAKIATLRAELNRYTIALRNVCMEHSDTCVCKGCMLAFLGETT